MGLRSAIFGESPAGVGEGGLFGTRAIRSHKAPKGYKPAKHQPRHVASGRYKPRHAARAFDFGGLSARYERRPIWSHWGPDGGFRGPWTGPQHARQPGQFVDVT